VPPGWSDWHALALPEDPEGEGRGGYYGYVTSDNGVATSHGTTEADYSTTVFGDDAVSFIESTPASTPLFLYFTPRAPHKPATPESRYAAGCPDITGAVRSPGYEEADVSDKPAYIASLRLAKDNQVRQIDDYRIRMCRTLLSVDDQVGRIVQALSDTGRLSTTLIIFASDNGFLTLEHRWIAKLVPYEDSIKVPLVIRYDPLTSDQQGTTDDHLVQNLDYARTIAAAARASTAGTQGRNLLKLLNGSQPAWRDAVLLEHLQAPAARPMPSYCGVRTARYMYAQYATGEEELYDVPADPYELQNVASDPTQALVKAQLHAEAMSLCNPRPPDWPAAIR
jgi:N-acetylglucosamine-6-sulfatase